MGGVTARDVAEFVGGRLVGNGDVVLTGVAPYKEFARNALVFIQRLERPVKLYDETCALTKYPMISTAEITKAAIIRVNHPKLMFLMAYNEFFRDSQCVNRVTMGEGCVIGSGVVIGEPGFGFAFDERNVAYRMPHIGGVKIGDRVEIGANTVIDSGTLSPTIIEDDVKIDNLVHIAHNVHVGARTLVITQAGLHGSSRIGCDCWIGPGAHIRNKVKVGNNVLVGQCANVVKDVPDNVVVAGNPARIIRERREGEWD